MNVGESLTLSADQIARRLSYLEITADDARRLREVHPLLQRHAGRIIDQFYEYLLSHEHTKAILSQAGLIGHLKEVQLKYFSEVTAGDYGAAYFENRLKVGATHNRVGLAPEWYLGAYTKYLHFVADVLRETFRDEPDRFFQTMVSLTKIINLDMGLAIDAYIHAAQKTLEAAHAQLLKVEAARQQLTDMIVHDLQNPLAGIAAFLKVLEPSPHLTPSVQEALQEALRRCHDLSQMILNVLQVSRAEQGKLATYIEDVDLARVASESALAFRLAAEIEGRTIVVEAPASMKVRTDQSLVRRVLYNLIRNALRHTPQGTHVVVRVEKTRPGFVTMSVIDDGPGIPPEARPVLFERFGAPALRKAGLRVDSGLGLSFCKAASDAVGASIRYESTGNGGSAFIVDFPLPG